MQNQRSGSNYFEQQPQQQGHGEAGAQGQTVFDTWNQKLLEMGVPRWNIGNHVVEPIMTILALVTLLFMGLQGLLFLGILYFVVKFSQRSSQENSRQGRRSNRNGRSSTSSGGHRLGR